MEIPTAKVIFPTLQQFLSATEFILRQTEQPSTEMQLLVFGSLSTEPKKIREEHFLLNIPWVICWFSVISPMAAEAYNSKFTNGWAPAAVTVH